MGSSLHPGKTSPSPRKRTGGASNLIGDGVASVSSKPPVDGGPHRKQCGESNWPDDVSTGGRKWSSGCRSPMRGVSRWPNDPFSGRPGEASRRHRKCALSAATK
jgi:hypothetical protein